MYKSFSKVQIPSQGPQTSLSSNSLLLRLKCVFLDPGMPPVCWPPGTLVEMECPGLPETAWATGFEWESRHIPGKPGGCGPPPHCLPYRVPGLCRTQSSRLLPGFPPPRKNSDLFRTTSSVLVAHRQCVYSSLGEAQPCHGLGPLPVQFHLVPCTSEHPPVPELTALLTPSCSPVWLCSC